MEVECASGCSYREVLTDFTGKDFELWMGRVRWSSPDQIDETRHTETFAQTVGRPLSQDRQERPEVQ
jgi:hypothetical protein